MQAVLLCDEKYNRKVEKVINDCDEAVIIVTSSILLQQLSEKGASGNIEYLDVYSDKHFEVSEEIIYNIITEITDGNPYFKQSQLPYMTINHLYDSMIRILVNFKFLMDEIIEKYHVDVLKLYGGNPQVPFLGINIGEGEQLFQWLYRRRWFLNYFVNKMYNGQIQILWKQKESRFKLELISGIRLFILNTGKALKQYPTMGLEQANPLESKEKQIVYLVVRVPQVVETLMPVYNVFEQSNKYWPVFVAYENYSNHTLISTLQEFNVRYVNLKNYISKVDVIDKFKIIYSSKMKDTGKVQIELGKEHSAAISAQRIVRELKVSWFDALLLENGLDNLYNSSEEVAYLVNSETHSWVAAVQGLWAKKHAIKSVGVSFVNLVVRPKSSWMDVYFTNSQLQKDLLEVKRPKEKYAYVGPIGYDLFFNTASHMLGNLKTIAIFTQPDMFRSDAFRIIDELLSIREKHKFTWKIVVKLHPRERNGKEFKKYEETGCVNVIFKEQTSLAVLQKADLAMAVHSTVLEQAVLVGVPAISVNFDRVHDISLEFLKEDTIVKVVDGREIEDYINSYPQMDKQFRNNRDNYIAKKLGGYRGDGAEKMYQYLQNE